MATTSIASTAVPDWQCKTTGVSLTMSPAPPSRPAPTSKTLAATFATEAIE
jgi:hypothetical protein